MANASNGPVPRQAGSLESSRKIKKRQLPPVFNGVESSCDEKNSDLLCPICFDVISEAHMTKCGHTFCFSCITTALDHNSRCPKCNFVLDKNDHIFPNFVLNELATKQQKKLSEEKKFKMDSSNARGVSELQEFLNKEENLSLVDVNYMLEILSQKKQQLEADCREAQINLLKEFLQQVRKHKEDELRRLNDEINLINIDTKLVEEMLHKHHATVQANSLMSNSIDRFDGIRPKCEQSMSSSCAFSNVAMQDGFNGSKYSSRQQCFSAIMANRRKRMHEHFDDLENSYFKTRAKDLFFTSEESVRKGLDEFSDSLSKFTRFSSVRPLATLNYANDHFNGSNIVSSIEFDKDNEYFAIAGVTKKIKVFEYSTVIRDAIDIHYPVNEMLCNSKISCISWSSYHKGMLASSDYEGTVTLWDAFTGQKVKTYQEHEKRCWSVDFNRVDTKLIASGSDDSKVKLWSTAMENSIACLEAKANVCCVKFNPESRYHLTFGSADHCVHYYDLRNTAEPLEVFKGHKKAVSYVKFLSPEEVVSASTDSQLKLWNVNQPQCLRSFTGHLNEKNFVGLATDGDFVACGSENNSLYVYYKGLSSHVLTFRFDTVRSILEKDKKEEDANEFVSAVCWRMGSNVVVAANSQGTIKVLELV